MSNLTITDKAITKEHESAETILKKAEKTDKRKYTELLIKYKAQARTRVHEYLKLALPLQAKNFSDLTEELTAIITFCKK